MSDQNAVPGEQYPHKITAEYDSQSAADQAVKTLIDRAGISSEQIKLVKPHDAEMARKIEPEPRGIARVLVKTHVTLGLAGLVVGLVLAGLLVAFGPTATQASPIMTFIAFGFLCPVLALLLAGAISLRPDHDRVIQKTRQSTDAGQWTVVVHCETTEQQNLVKDAVGHSAQTL